MYLMYVDESGDTGLANSPTRYFILSGLVVHESRWRDFVSQLIAFRRTLRLAYGLPIRTELHAVEFINRQVFGIGRMPITRHLRLAMLRNAIDELAKMDFISITNVVVDKLSKPSTYDVFNAAWGTLFQRFENTLVHGNFPGRFREDYGMVITDATAGTKLARMVRKMAVHNYIPYNTRYATGSRNMPIKRIIEDPHGKDSRETPPIQLCDIVAYFLHQRHAPNSYIRRSGAERYFDRLTPVLNVHASRYDKLGIVRL